jgi:hypothetical protein
VALANQSFKLQGFDTAPYSKAKVKVRIYIAVGQGSYFVTTGLWPVVHLRSFVAVTGPKTDYWLVQAFGVLVAAVGAVLLVRGVQARVDATTRQFGLATSLALAAIDVWFVSTGAISAIYLADGALELLLAVAWLWARGPRIGSPRS